jgi:hypothetical protein
MLMKVLSVLLQFEHDMVILITWVTSPLIFFLPSESQLGASWLDSPSDVSIITWLHAVRTNSVSDLLWVKVCDTFAPMPALGLPSYKNSKKKMIKASPQSYQTLLKYIKYWTKSCLLKFILKYYQVSH